MNVSTVRKVMGALAHEGLVVRKRRWGMLHDRTGQPDGDPAKAIQDSHGDQGPRPASFAGPGLHAVKLPQ